MAWESDRRDPYTASLRQHEVIKFQELGSFWRQLLFFFPFFFFDKCQVSCQHIYDCSLESQTFSFESFLLHLAWMFDFPLSYALFCSLLYLKTFFTVLPVYIFSFLFLILFIYFSINKTFTHFKMSKWWLDPENVNRFIYTCFKAELLRLAHGNIPTRISALYPGMNTKTPHSDENGKMNNMWFLPLFSAHSQWLRCLLSPWEKTSNIQYQ